MLRLYKVSLAPGAVLEVAQRDSSEVVYVLSGQLTGGGIELNANEGKVFTSGVTLSVPQQAGPTQALFWCVTSEDQKFEAPAGARPLHFGHLLQPSLRDWIMRLDTVSFEPNAAALLHVHDGPGIRYLAEGNLWLESRGNEYMLAPGGTWFESGPDPMYAQATEDGNARFVRVLVLPPALKGGVRSIHYVDPADANKPKRQVNSVLGEADLWPAQS
jgi:quercetin dioxygenase-like cupin family protein